MEKKKENAATNLIHPPLVNHQGTNTLDLISIKFLEEVKRAALEHKLDPIPDKDSSLYQVSMFVKGMADALSARGYKIVKDE